MFLFFVMINMYIMLVKVNFQIVRIIDMFIIDKDLWYSFMIVNCC